MIWYILIALLMILFTWILFAPVIMQVDTDRQKYRVMLPGVLSAQVVPSEDLFYIRAWIFFIPVKFNPFLVKRKDRVKDTSEKRKKKRRFRGGTRKIRSLLGALHVRRLDLDLDTDDVVLNAWLVPAMAAANRNENIDLRVNFEGNLFMYLDLRTRLGLLLWIFLTKR